MALGDRSECGRYASKKAIGGRRAGRLAQGRHVCQIKSPRRDERISPSVLGLGRKHDQPGRKMAQILRAVFVVVLAGFGAWIGTDLRAQEEETSPTAADFQKPKNKWVAELTMPRGRGPFPAVMVLHGCDGVAWHSRDWARRVASWGYATLIVDSYTPRGQKVICEDVSVVPFTKRAQDIAAGADYLRTLPAIDPNRIGAVGLSMAALVRCVLPEREAAPRPQVCRPLSLTIRGAKAKPRRLQLMFSFLLERPTTGRRPNAASTFWRNMKRWKADDRW